MKKKQLILRVSRQFNNNNNFVGDLQRFLLRNAFVIREVIYSLCFIDGCLRLMDVFILVFFWHTYTEFFFLQIYCNN